MERPHVARGVREAVGLAADEVARLGFRRGSGQHVVQRQAELGGKGPDCLVAGVDELAAVLGDLAVGEHVPRRVAATAEAGAGLIYRWAVAGLLQAVSGREPGEAGADDAYSCGGGQAGGRQRRRKG